MWASVPTLMKHCRWTLKPKKTLKLAKMCYKLYPHPKANHTHKITLIQSLWLNKRNKLILPSTVNFMDGRIPIASYCSQAAATPVAT